jgi:peptidoglycan hydrolase CwlO-like protein
MITIHAPITLQTYDAPALAAEFAALKEKIDALSLKFEELRADQTELDRLTAQLEAQNASLNTTVQTTPKE